MNRAARKTHENYRDYQSFVEHWNVQNPRNPKKLEGNHNIRKALIYYNSLQSSDDEQDDTPKLENGSTEQTPPVSMQPDQSSQRKKDLSELSEQTIDDVERFINDDDNLTY